MSTTSPLSDPATPAQRTTAALARAQSALPQATNAKLLQAVLLEIAADAVVTDATFAARINERYQELAPPPPPPKATAPKTRSGGRATPKVSDLLEPLTPIKFVPNLEITLEGPPDPYFLLDVFGAHQLERALNQRSVADLRKAAAIVQAQTSSRLPAKATKPQIVAYIMEHVAGPVTVVAFTPPA
jgi:hypothetical protein